MLSFNHKKARNKPLKIVQIVQNGKKGKIWKNCCINQRMHG